MLPAGNEVVDAEREDGRDAAELEDGERRQGELSVEFVELELGGVSGEVSECHFEGSKGEKYRSPRGHDGHSSRR